MRIWKCKGVNSFFVSFFTFFLLGWRCREGEFSDENAAKLAELNDLYGR